MGTPGQADWEIPKRTVISWPTHIRPQDTSEISSTSVGRDLQSIFLATKMLQFLVVSEGPTRPCISEASSLAHVWADKEVKGLQPMVQV